MFFMQTIFLFHVSQKSANVYLSETLFLEVILIERLVHQFMWSIVSTFLTHELFQNDYITHFASNFIEILQQLFDKSQIFLMGFEIDWLFCFLLNWRFLPETSYEV